MSRARRVCVIGDFVGNSDEGAHVYFRSLVDGYRECGVQVEVVSLAPGRAGPVAPSVIAELRKGDFDLVQYIPRSGLTTASMLRTAVLTRAVSSPVYGTFLQTDTPPAPVPWLARGIAALVLDAGLAAYLKEHGVDAAVTGVGVDMSRFSPMGDARTDLWPGAEGPRLLHVGHLKRGRNLECFAEAARLGARCLVIGSTSTEPEQDVVAMLESAGVAVVREFVADLPAVYRGADVYVFPVVESRSAIAVPLSVMEALATGTRVVSTHFGAIEQHVPHTDLLSLVQPDALVDAALVAPERPSVSPPRTFRTWQAVARDNTVRAASRRARPDRHRLVVLVGVDGAGKSTQAALLVSSAREAGLIATTVWARWNPLLLRPLMRLFGSLSAAGDSARRASTDGAPNLSAKRRLFRSTIARRMWRAAALIDYGSRTLPIVLRARRGTDLVVVDRYYFDALVDFAVNFGVETVPEGAFRVFPQPTEVVLLDVPVDVAMSRKADIPSRSYIAERRARYVALAELNGWHVVDASRSTDDVHQDIARAVLSS